LFTNSQTIILTLEMLNINLT